MSTWEPALERPEHHDGAAESDPDVIHREIDHTRHAMAETLEEIQRRLEPEQVTNYIKDVAYYVVLELKGAARDLAGEAMSWVRTASPRATADTSKPDSQDAPRLAESTRALLSHYTGRQVGTKAREMSNQAGGLWKHLEANPLALGAMGLVVGSLVAAIAPRTQHEDQLMGTASDHILENVQATAERAAQTVRSAAVETGSDVLKNATNPQ